MSGDHSLRDFDWALLGLTMAIVVLGVLEIYSATRNTVWQDAHLRQILWVAVGLVGLWVFSVVNYNSLIHHAVTFYVISLVLLVLVLVAGLALGGGRRWLPIPGGLTLQVSEFVKVVLVLLVAKFFSDLPRERMGWKNLLRISALFAVPVLLVARQPDLSTAFELHVDPSDRGVFGGFALEAHGDLRIGGGVDPAAGVAAAQAVSEGALDHVFGSRKGSARGGLSADPVEDCGGRRGNLGFRVCERLADAAPVYSRAPH